MTLSVCLWIVVLGASVGRDEYIKSMISTLKKQKNNFLKIWLLFS